ncbi:4783_t:CDS:1, partial [Cetraspora pellucida]
HVLRCSDWPPSEKTKYIQKTKEESLVPRKCANDCFNDEKDENDLSPKQTTSADNDNIQQLPAPRQNTIIDW